MNIFTGVRGRLALSLTILFIAAGCTMPPPPATPRSFSCASLADSNWKEFRFGADSPDEVVATAVRLWGIEIDEVQVFTAANAQRVASVRWPFPTTDATSTYQAWFTKDQLLAKIRVEWGYPKPTLAQVIDCLDFPDHYISFLEYGPHGLYLSLVLLYPDIGLVVRHFDVIWSYEPLKIHPQKQMGWYVIVPPGTAEQVAIHMFSYGLEVRRHINSVCLLKLWPESIEAMVIASDEEKVQCGVR